MIYRYIVRDVQRHGDDYFVKMRCGKQVILTETYLKSILPYCESVDAVVEMTGKTHVDECKECRENGI